MRAARTPPDPAPMTNRSTSSGIALPPFGPNARQLELVVAALSHFRAHSRDHGLGIFVDPDLRALGRLFAGLRLLLDHLLAEWRLVEGDHVLEVLFGERTRITERDLLVQFLPARRAFLPHQL